MYLPRHGIVTLSGNLRYMTKIGLFNLVILHDSPLELSLRVLIN